MGIEKITYEQMMQMLRNEQHKAPVTWDQLEASLNLDQGITELPTYKAPDNLWAGIEEGLEDSKPEKIARNYNGLFILLASILFFVSTIIVVKFLGQSDQQTGFDYKSEVELASLYENKVMLDDNIDEVLGYIENNSFMFTEEQLEEFNTQLAEINAALEKLMEMQENYGTDESSNRMMARMERDKANLLKSMISNS